MKNLFQINTNQPTFLIIQYSHTENKDKYKFRITHQIRKKEISNKGVLFLFGSNNKGEFGATK